MTEGAELVAKLGHALPGAQKVQMALLCDPLVTEGAAYAHRDVLVMGEFHELGARGNLSLMALEALFWFELGHSLCSGVAVRALELWGSMV